MTKWKLVPVEPMENIALNEWLDKTEWVQKEINTFPVSSLGMHRADVMRLEIERLRKLLSAAPTPAEPPAELPTWENGDDPLVGGGLISRGVVDFATVGIWPTKPAPSVPDGWRSLTDVEWMNIVNFDRAYSSYDKEEAVNEAVKRTEAKLKELNAAPTPAEAPYMTSALRREAAEEITRLRNALAQSVKIGAEHRDGRLKALEWMAALESRLREIGDLAASCRTGPALREAMAQIETMTDMRHNVVVDAAIYCSEKGQS